MNALLEHLAAPGDALRWTAVALSALVWFALLPRWGGPRWTGGAWAALLLSAGGAFALGFRIEGARSLGGGYWTLGPWGFPLTVVWIVVIARSLRFVRGLQDGRRFLKIVGLLCLAFWLIAWLQPQPLPFALALGGLLLLGVGWALWRGWTPCPFAAQGLGVLLALLSIAGVLKTSATLSLLVPLGLLGFPPLAARTALGALARPVGAALPTRHLFGLYAALSALSVLAVGWTQRPGWGRAWLVLSLATAAPALAVQLLKRPAEPAWRAGPARVHLFGIPFDRLDFREVVSRAEGFLSSRTPHLIATPDTTALMRARRDVCLRRCYQRADLVTADGTGVVWASRWLGGGLPERVTGIDLMQALCQRAAERGLRVFLLGAAPGVAGLAALRLRQRYPGLNVVGTHHGYFGRGGEKASAAPVIRLIRAARPDLLFVGLGVPRQERWLVEHGPALGVPLMMGVGGSLDVLSGHLPRAPQAWQRWGLEWLYRLCWEPRRLGRALLIPAFLARVLGLKLGALLQGSPGSTTSASSS